MNRTDYMTRIADVCRTLPSDALPGRAAMTPDGEHHMTLLDLVASLTLTPTRLSPEQRRRALLALNRLGGAVRIASQPADPSAVLPLLAERHAAMGTVPKQAGEERRALERALALLPPPAHLIQAVANGTATLAHAAEAVALQGWDAKRVGDHEAALAAYARICEGLPLDAIPAREAAIAKRLAGTPYTAFGVQQRTFRNLRSRILHAVRLVDLHGRHRLKQQSVPPAWSALLEPLTPSWRKKLWPLVSFATVHGLEPDRITPETLDALQAELARRDDADAHRRLQHVVYAWEKLDHARLGLVPLPRRYSQAAASPLGWDALPESFRASWAAYVEAELALPRERRGATAVWDYTAHYAEEDEFAHLFDDRAGVMTGTGLDDGLTRYRAAITYAAYADPAPLELTDFRQVVTLRHLRGAASAVLARQQARWRPGQPPVEKKTNYRWSIALTLCLLAERTEAVGPEELAGMRLVKLDLDPKVHSIKLDPGTGEKKASYKKGSVMGPRHRSILEAIVDNDAAFLAWAEAPDRLWAEAEAAARAGRITAKDAYDGLIACLHEIQRCCPLRIENLAEIRIGGPQQNLSLVGETGRLELGAREVKYGADDDSIPLTARATQRLRRWCAVFRPVLLRHVKADPDNPFLIPARKGHKLARSVGDLYVARNRRCGIYLTAHVGRHLGAWVLIEAGFDLERVSSILGHASPETTRQYYAVLSRARDLRLYQEALARTFRSRTQRMKRAA
jgi:Phage integrase family